MGRKLTYEDFTQTGYQDCGNVFNTREYHDVWRGIGKPRGPTAARMVVRAAWGDDMTAYKEWLDNMPEDEVDQIVQAGLHLRGAYKAWRTAWQDCAESAVKEALKKWIRE